MSSQRQVLGIEDMAVKRLLLGILAKRLAADNPDESKSACGLLRAIDGDLLRAEQLERERSSWIRAMASLRNDKIAAVRKAA